MEKQSLMMERACTLGMTALFAVAMLLLGWSSMFGHGQASGPLAVIAPWIHPLVFGGGVALLVLFGFQIYGLWKGDKSHHELTHHHDHSHGHSHDQQHEETGCQHDHTNCDHDHHEHHHHHEHAHSHALEDHGHEHGWSPIRYIPLVIPLLLCAMGLPDANMIRAYEQDLIASHGGGNFEMVASPAPGEPLRRAWALGIAAPGGDGFGLALALGSVADQLDEDPNAPVDRTDLAELERITALPVQRQQWSLKRNVEVQGMYNPGQEGDKGLQFFSLVQLRIACCLGDARPATLYAASRKPIDLKMGTWVTVRGRLDFIQTEEGVKPAMRVFQVKATPMPARPYLTK